MGSIGHVAHVEENLFGFKPNKKTLALAKMNLAMMNMEGQETCKM